MLDQPRRRVMGEKTNHLGSAMSHPNSEGVKDDVAIGMHEEADDPISVVGGGGGLEGGREGGSMRKQRLLDTA